MKYRRLLWLIPLFFFSAGGGASDALLAKTIRVDGIQRSYYLQDASSPGTGLRPLILALHGGGKGNGKEWAKFAGLRDLAGQQGFLLAYPNGIQGQWNDGRGISYHRRNNADVDDVAFISALIDKLIRQQHVDPRRVYVMGISNGGMMAQRIGCELSDKVRAIAAIVANLPEKLEDCRPASPVSVLLMNGTRDPLIPWRGGDVHFFRKTMGKVLSTKQTLHYWRRYNDCPQHPTIRAMPDHNKRDGSSVREYHYGPCSGNTEVILYAVKGGGHTFPGSPVPDRPLLLGRKNMDMNGPQVIMDFFAVKH